MSCKLPLVVVLLLLLENVTAAEDGLQAKNESLRVLSRRKRYLVFPEGSSLQLGKYLQ